MMLGARQRLGPAEDQDRPLERIEAVARIPRQLERCPARRMGGDLDPASLMMVAGGCESCQHSRRHGQGAGDGGAEAHANVPFWRASGAPAVGGQ